MLLYLNFAETFIASDDIFFNCSTLCFSNRRIAFNKLSELPDSKENELAGLQ